MAIDVGKVMTRNVVTARPEATAAEIARLLDARGISAVPICDGDGRLLGIVSEGDLLRPFRQEHDLKRDWWLALLAEGSELAPEFIAYISHDRRTAEALMTTRLLTVSPGTPLAEAADLLLRNNIKRLPVLSDGKLVGIISRADLVRAFLDTENQSGGYPRAAQ